MMLQAIFPFLCKMFNLDSCSDLPDKLVELGRQRKFEHGAKCIQWIPPNY